MQRHDELIGDDDEYDELYGDLNIGEGFLQPHPSEAPGPNVSRMDMLQENRHQILADVFPIKNIIIADINSLI